MTRLKTVTLLLLGLLAAAQVQAFTFSFPFPGSSNRGNQPPPGPGPWQFRPQGPSNARGVPPGYQMPGQIPGQMPGYQPGGYQPGGYQNGWPAQYGGPYGQQTRPAARAPRIETEVADQQPYVQENVLLKLRVISDQNLQTAIPEIPSGNDFLLHKIDGPTARSRTGSGGRPEIVNELVYTVTPLRAGDLELPPFVVTGTLAGSGYGRAGGTRFEAKGREPIRLQVRPAMTSVSPWLPLQDLSLRATLDGGEEVEEGQPVTLMLELTALGATGSQLPSLEPMLRNADFRVYREQTLTEGGLSADGRRLEGKRTEYYTLVPRSGGRLQLPEIRVPWWNVSTGTREYAGLPIRTLQVEGEGGPFGLSASTRNRAASGGVGWFWLPLAGLALLLLGYWVGVWYKGRPPREGTAEPLGARLTSGLRSAASDLSDRAAQLAGKLDPAPAAAALGQRLSRAMPASSRFLRCVKAADAADDPAQWCQRFQTAACRHLQFDAQTPLPGLTGQILALRPGADPQQLSRLMEQLDAALYGKQDIDFKRWKKQFRREVGRGRGLLRGKGAGRHIRRPLLPELNPA